MKISEIPVKPQPELKDSITFIVSGEAKKALSLVANLKDRTLSELVREIVENFLADNTEEIQKLG